MSDKIGSIRPVVHSPPVQAQLVAEEGGPDDLSPGTQTANALTSHFFFLQRSYVPEAILRLDVISPDRETTLEVEVARILKEDQKEIFHNMHQTALNPCTNTIGLIAEYKRLLLEAIQEQRRAILASDLLDDIRGEFQVMIDALPVAKTEDGVLQSRVEAFFQGFVEDSSVVNLGAFKIKCRERLPLVRELYERDAPVGFDAIPDIPAAGVVAPRFTRRIERIWTRLANSVNSMALLKTSGTVDSRFRELTIEERLQISIDIEKQITRLFFNDGMRFEVAIPAHRLQGKRFQLISVMEKKYHARLLEVQREFALYK